jgi:hypothetical protein
VEIQKVLEQQGIAGLGEEVYSYPIRFSKNILRP